MNKLSCEHIKDISWERQVGFLHLLDQVIKILGLALAPFIAAIYKIVLQLLNNAQSYRCELENIDIITYNDLVESYDDVKEKNLENEEDSNDITSQFKNKNQSLRVRSLCLIRVAGVFLFYFRCLRMKKFSYRFNSAVF
jgi:hypothetical protein